MVIVVKIGGSLLKNHTDYITAGKFISNLRKEDNVIVVVSAMKGVTSKLLSIAQGKASLSEYDKIIAKYLNILSELGASKHVISEVKRLANEGYETISLLRKEPSSALVDRLLSLGERISKFVMKETLNKLGLKTIALDGGDIGITTTSEYTQAKPIFHKCFSNIRKTLSELLEKEVTPVIAGFIGKDEKGMITTMGRGASDLTATIIASSICASKLMLITNVPGIMTTDPNLIPTAQSLPYVSLNEAITMAKYRVKKFHPLTFEPFRMVENKTKIYVGHYAKAFTEIVRHEVPPEAKVVVIQDNNKITVIGYEIDKVLDSIKEKDGLLDIIREDNEPIAIIQVEYEKVNYLLNEIHNLIIRRLKECFKTPSGREYGEN